MNAANRKEPQSAAAPHGKEPQFEIAPRSPKPMPRLQPGDVINPKELYGFYPPGIVDGAPCRKHRKAWPSNPPPALPVISDGEKRVYRKLYDYGRSHGGSKIYPGLNQLEKELGRTTRQLRRDLARLQSLGLLRQIHRDGLKRSRFELLYHPMFERTCLSPKMPPEAASVCPLNEPTSPIQEPTFVNLKGQTHSHKKYRSELLNAEIEKRSSESSSSACSSEHRQAKAAVCDDEEDEYYDLHDSQNSSASQAAYRHGC